MEIPPEVLNWILLGTMFIVLEIFTPGVFFILFGVSAFLVSIAIYFGSIALNAQLVMFLAVSFVLLLFVRPLFKLTTKEPPRKIMQDEMVGKVVPVIKTIKKDDRSGQVKYDGEVWRAITGDDGEFKEGSKVEIVRLDSNKLVVKAIEKAEEKKVDSSIRKKDSDDKKDETEA